MAKMFVMLCRTNINFPGKNCHYGIIFLHQHICYHPCSGIVINKNVDIIFKAHDAFLK